MEYTIDNFVTKLKEYFTESSLFPYMQGEYLSSWNILQDSAKKHPKRNPPHLKDMTKMCLDQTTTILDENTMVFDFGNERMETYYPYYHILQDAPVIRKKMQGTKKTKGSQAKVEDLGKRNYGITSWNGKTFTKEYTRNVRGSRNRLNKVSHWETIGGKKVWINRDSGAYQNVHYHYIDNVLDNDVVLKLASSFQMKPMRKENGGLAEEYMSEMGEGNDELSQGILNTFFSFD